MGKEFVGFRTGYKDDYRRAKVALGMSSFTEVHEAIMRAVTKPWLPLSAKTLEALDCSLPQLGTKPKGTDQK
jgi:hypothetical protein